MRWSYIHRAFLQRWLDPPIADRFTEERAGKSSRMISTDEIKDGYIDGETM